VGERVVGLFKGSEAVRAGMEQGDQLLRVSLSAEVTCSLNLQHLRDTFVIPLLFCCRLQTLTCQASALSCFFFQMLEHQNAQLLPFLPS
jgi:hypothetical protein